VAELIDYMTVRGAAVANLHSNHDSIKLSSEEEGIQLKNNTASLSRALRRAIPKLRGQKVWPVISAKLLIEDPISTDSRLLAFDPC